MTLPMDSHVKKSTMSKWVMSEFMHCYVIAYAIDIQLTFDSQLLGGWSKNNILLFDSNVLFPQDFSYN